jgi:uncharacterized repeat protein (TIGR01451 family)
MVRIRSTVLLTATMVGVFLSLSGCASFSLPAIDPSGERIFLPSPSYTTLVSPYDSAARFPCLPQPAFTEPPPIPPCTNIPARPGAIGVTAQPLSDRMILAPAKIVAPVNSEVILLAGVCGKEGFYVTKQPIEWMLSPDSVGNIIALADSNRPHIAKLVHHSPRKECNNLAVTRTSTEPHVVNRGTPSLTDDVWVGKGQSWISVSSPTEGVSYITALANRAENWETRRQTSTIYWVDMQWAFPAPRIVRAGELVALSTTVTKTSTGNAAANAIVRYEITGGTGASFGNGRTTAEINTDENGRADIQVVQDAPGPGATQIGIQILSAAIQGTSGSRVPLGQGSTTVTWSAPGLAVALSGPQLLSRNGVATYRIEVSNPGDIATRGAVVHVEFPAALKYINSRPSGQLFGNRIEWRLGDLPPRQVQYLELSFQALNSGEFNLLARATSPDTQEARSAAMTRIVESGLAVQFIDPPATATVGGRADFNFQVTNTGGVPINNIVVLDTFDAGLQPAYNVDPVQPLKLPPFNLAAGETARHGVAFFVQRPGQLCHTLQITADGGHTASTRACITATQPVLKVSVQKVGPAQARVGESVRFVISVTNSGEGVLTNLQIRDVPDENLQPDQGTLGLEKIPNTNSIVWRIGSLGPGQSLTREIVCICRTPSQRAQNQVEVSADGNVREVAAAAIVILPAAEPARQTPPATPPMGGQPPVSPQAPNTQTPAARSGQLAVEIAHLGDPPVGGTVSFIIVLRNNSPDPDQDIQLTLLLPNEFRQQNPMVQQSLRAPVTSLAGGIGIGPIREIRGHEPLDPIRVTVTANRAGKYTIKVKAESRRSQPVEAETEVNVVPR